MHRKGEERCLGKDCWRRRGGKENEIKAESKNEEEDRKEDQAEKRRRGKLQGKEQRR